MEEKNEITLDEMQPAEQNEKEQAEQKEKSKKAFLEIIVVVMLGLTAVLTAWATWLDALHSGNESYHYTLGNYFASRGTAEYNAANLTYMQDVLLFNEVNNLMLDQYFAKERNDEEELEVLYWKVDQIMYGLMSVELTEAVEWALEESDAQGGEFVSPFTKEGFVDSYYETSFATLAEAEEVLTMGQEDGDNADSYGLVTVIYAVVMFLLGIAGTLASYKNRVVIVVIACAAFLIATAYMFTIPLPADFSLLGIIGGN